MTDPTSLTPAAQAVLDAANQAYDQAATAAQGTAAALRAAADRVIEEASPVEAILAIADELEATS